MGRGSWVKTRRGLIVALVAGLVGFGLGGGQRHPCAKWG